MLPLESFLQELCKIAGMYDAMPPPASPQATALARLPAPGRLPGASGGLTDQRWLMNPEEQLKSLGRPPSIAPKGGTIPSPAPAAPSPVTDVRATAAALPTPGAAIPRPGASAAPRAAVSPTMQAPAPNHLGAPISTRGITTPMTHMPTVHPASGMVGAAEQAVSKLRKPISGVVQRVARAV